MFPRKSSPRRIQKNPDQPFNESKATILRPGTIFEGKIIGDKDVKIEGEFYGEIFIKGTLLISEGAKLFCQRIIANRVLVKGTIHGDITTKSLNVYSTGKIFGNPICTEFTTEEGSFVKGQIKMSSEVDLNFEDMVGNDILDKLAGDSTTDAPVPAIKIKKKR